MRTTATILARLDYRALAQGFGVAYQEICGNGELAPAICGALEHPGPVLVRVVADYDRRPIRWLRAARQRYMSELSHQQRMRLIARAGSRALNQHPEND